LHIGEGFADARIFFSINQYRISKGYPQIPEGVIRKPGEQLKSFMSLIPLQKLSPIPFAIDNVEGTDVGPIEPPPKRITFSIPEPTEIPQGLRPFSLLESLSECRGKI
jgi:hypothetical protein